METLGHRSIEVLSDGSMKVLGHGSIGGVGVWRDRNVEWEHGDVGAWEHRRCVVMGAQRGS